MTVRHGTMTPEQVAEYNRITKDSEQLSIVPKVYGYARVSTQSQNIERQIRNILRVNPDAIIYEEKFTGRTLQREKFDKLLKLVKSGDTIIFDSVSRMSRNAEDGYKTYMSLFNSGVELIFINEPYINTVAYKNALQGKIDTTVTTGDDKTDRLIGAISEALNSYMQDLAREQIRLAFEQSQKEVDDLSERTRQGIETARLAGKQIGQPKGAVYNVKGKDETKKKIKKYCRDFGGSNTDADTIKIIGISRNTYFKYKKELLMEAAQ